MKGIEIIVYGIMIITLLVFGQTIMASTDIGVDMSGSDYNETYEQQKDTTIAAMSFMSFIPYLIVVAGFIAVLMFLYKQV